MHHRDAIWLVEQGYRYLVVRRGGVRQFDDTRSVAIETAGGETIRFQKEFSEDGAEVRLYCHSIEREAKESAMMAQFSQRFEDGLQRIVEGLQKPRTEKRYDKLLERIGRLKEKSHAASRHYMISLIRDESGKKVTALSWENPRCPEQWRHILACIACAAMN